MYSLSAILLCSVSASRKFKSRRGREREGEKTSEYHISTANASFHYFIVVVLLFVVGGVGRTSTTDGSARSSKCLGGRNPAVENFSLGARDVCLSVCLRNFAGNMLRQKGFLGGYYEAGARVATRREGWCFSLARTIGD